MPLTTTNKYFYPYKNGMILYIHSKTGKWDVSNNNNSMEYRIRKQMEYWKDGCLLTIMRNSRKDFNLQTFKRKIDERLQ